MKDIREKTEVLTSGNIDKVIASLKKSIKSQSQATLGGFLIPKFYNTGEIDRNKYRGTGRPRRGDYVFKETLELLKKTAKDYMTK